MTETQLRNQNPEGTTDFCFSERYVDCFAENTLQQLFPSDIWGPVTPDIYRAALERMDKFFVIMTSRIFSGDFIGE